MVILVPLLFLKDKNNLQIINDASKKGICDTPKKEVTLLASPQPKSNVMASPQASRRAGSHSLELFFRKIFQLASVRSKDLCLRLQISPKIYQQVWQALNEVLTSQHQLMCNRHLDQLIMCTLYGVCRVNQLGITFRTIIEQYRAQAQASSKIFREVVLNSMEEKGDIITFYNSIYIPIMETYLLQFQQNAEKENSMENEPEKVQKSHQVSPSPISTKHNLYLSPMKHSLRSTTPNPKFLFSFGESPAKGLQQINQTINSPKPRMKAKPQRRLFNDQNSEDSSSSSPSLKRKSEEGGSEEDGGDEEEGGEIENESNMKVRKVSKSGRSSKK